MNSTSHNSCRENIKVICRLRPENQLEKNSGQKLCITANKNSLKITMDFSSEKKQSELENHEFTFDQVFGPESRQVELFNTVAKPMIEGALEGWNGTLFCYGQTSSGKTHTMEGKHEDLELKGIIPRMMEYVFELINNASNDLEFTVKCSFLEIYNEKIQDLLDPRKNNLMVKEEKSKGIWVEDATEVYVMNKEEMRDVFKCGSENRKIGATAMNDKSSRSHSLFIVTIFQKDSKTDSTKTGKLYFVDLAGSEKLSKTKIEAGTLLEEAKNINKSLLMLGMVINSLTEGRSHIPYRDSKLTRVLQESLGGNSHTTLIITCSMSAFNDKESLSTLRFGQRAKSIKNKLTVNTERSAKELLLKLNEAEEKIKYYQNLINKMQRGEGVIFPAAVESKPITESINNNNYNTNKSSKSKCDDCAKAMQKLLNQHIEFVSMQEELEKQKHEKRELEEEILTRNREIYEMNEKVLITELKTKLFIEEELKNFQQLQMKLENIFLCNQNKLLLTSKLKNILEITRYEIFILIKANKLKIDKSQHTSLHEEITNYEKNLEESLEILNRIEEYIIADNKSFNDIVDLIAGKNSEGDFKVSDFNPTSSNFNNSPNKDYNQINFQTNNNNYINGNRGYSSNNINNQNTLINNINLNINKNININIFNNEKKLKQKRRNSFSYIRKRSLLNRNYTNSCGPGFNTNYNTARHSINFFSLSKNKKQPSFNSNNTVNVNMNNDSGNSFIVHSEKSFDLENQIESTFNKNKEKIDINLILKKQRKTITNLAMEYKNIKDALSNKNREFYEKEVILNKNHENILKSENQIKEYEYIIEDLKNQLIEKDNQFEQYKNKTIKDFEYKEKKIVELINKVEDLEDENYKMIHFNKDKDKKKYYLMEKQVKEFTIEMQKLITKNSQFKSTLEKKDEEIKSLNTKIIELKNRPMVESIRNKMSEISFCGNNPQDLNFGMNTPSVANNQNQGFRYATINELLAAKLMNYNSISPQQSNNFDKKSTDFSPMEHNRMFSNIALQMVNARSSMNISGYNNSNIPINFVISPNSGSISSTNIQNLQNNTTNSKQPNMMRIIRGGNANSKNNFFLSKMLNSGNNDFEIRDNSAEQKKVNLDKLKNKKNEEMKIYENDNLNISNGSDNPEIQRNSNRANTTKKEKGGIFGFFSKLITK